MKMKRTCLIFTFALALTLTLLFTTSVYANMAAPAESDIGSAITFEENDIISVLSEVLDIKVKGNHAGIVATYRMKNTGNKSVSTKTMFLSPNIQTSGVRVVVDDKDASFAVDSFALNYDTKIEKNDWQYAVLTNDEIAGYSSDHTVDAISFDMDFTANEEYDVIVSYTYRLGGYPDYNYNAKNGIINYYLTPAAMWKDFSSLTINLSLDKDMPVIESSNLDFKKLKTRTYQYTSDTLPDENLNIVIDENWWQNIFSTLRSPYFAMGLKMFSPLILSFIFVVMFIVWRVLKKKK